MNTNVGVIGGHHSDITMCVFMILLPISFAIITFRTHDNMIQNSTCYWNKTNQIAGNEDPANESDSKLDSSNKVIPPYNEYKFIIIARACFVCWYTWNVSVNFPEDYVVVPFYSFIASVTTYLMCLPFSREVMDVCSAIMNNDLSLQCDSPQKHDKNE